MKGLKFFTNAASPAPVAIGHLWSAAERVLFAVAANAAVAAAATTTAKATARRAILVR